MVSYDLGAVIRGFAQGKSRLLAVSWYESLSTVNKFSVNIFPRPFSRLTYAYVEESSLSMEHVSLPIWVSDILMIIFFFFRSHPAKILIDSIVD